MPDGVDVTQDQDARASAWEGGAGSTLVLLHGLGGTWHIWKPVLNLLTPFHRVIALTLPGHPGGPALPFGVEPSVDLLADMLLAELRLRGIERAHVAGNSLGGWLALELARRGFAQSVTALSPAGGWQTDKDYAAVSRSFRIVFALLPLLIFLTVLFLRFAGVRRALNKQAMEHGERVPPADFHQSMNSMRNTRMLPALLTRMGIEGGIKPMRPAGIPVHIAWGEHDKVIPFETYGRPMLGKIEGSIGCTVSGVGHVPMYDDPEQVAAVIRQTITKVDALAA